MSMNVCLRARLFLRRRWRGAWRFYRDVMRDIQYRHIWRKTTTPRGQQVYRCNLCGTVSSDPVGGHRDPCKMRRPSTKLRVAV